jgi:hypothetical protein
MKFQGGVVEPCIAGSDLTPTTSNSSLGSSTIWTLPLRAAWTHALGYVYYRFRTCSRFLVDVNLPLFPPGTTRVIKRQHLNVTKPHIERMRHTLAVADNTKASFISPMLLVRTERLPEGRNWLYELLCGGPHFFCGALSYVTLFAYSGESHQRFQLKATTDSRGRHPVFRRCWNRWRAWRNRLKRADSDAGQLAGTFSLFSNERGGIGGCFAPEYALIRPRHQFAYEK